MSEINHIREIVRNFINSSINIEGIGDDENLFESGLANSLFAIQLTNFVERRFSIEIRMDDLSIENFKSINATTAFVSSKSVGALVCTPPAT
jgi:acyl carrier protein